MKKRLLLFAAVLSASANFVFAETKTVQDSNGNTFTYDTQKDLDPSSYEGQTTAPATASITPNSDFYQLTLNSNLTTTIADCNLIYNVKLAEASGNPGAISSFTERLQSSNTVYDVVVSESQIATYIYENGEITGYSVKEDSKDYTRYVDACERAIEINNKLVVRGNEVPRLYDFEEMEVNPKLYYMVTGKKVKNYIPILNVNGEYTRGVVYSNSFVTYNPVGIADGTASYTVDGDGKVGYVHGVVDNGKIEEILANYNNYLNFDFSDASVLGTISTNINDNRIAYFNAGVDVATNKGQNIIVDSQCKNYVISDNGQEIYVATAFQAKSSQYKRTVTSSTYGTIVLPFTVENTSNVFEKQAKLTGYVPSPENESLTTNKLTFTSTEVIAPNTPYLFKSLSTVTGESIFSGNVNGTVNATGNAASAIPLYHLFVEQSQKLNPRYLLMIIPARWYAGGRGLDSFRETMLNDRRIKHITDYADSSECFPGVNIAGGVCYAKGVESLSTIVFPSNPFGFRTYIRGEKEQFKGSVKLITSEGFGYVRRTDINKSLNAIDSYNVIMTRAMSGGNKPGTDGKYQIVPATMKVMNPNEICAETYICIGTFNNRNEAENLRSYLSTMFVRFLMLQAMSSIMINKDAFQFVPLFVPLQDFSKPWTDEELYKKYNLTDDEIAFIESMIRPME